MCGKRRVHRVENNNLNYQTRLIWSVHNLHHVSDCTDTLKRRLPQQNLLMNSGSWISRSRHHTMVDKLWDIFILQPLRDFSALALSYPPVNSKAFEWDQRIFQTSVKTVKQNLEHPNFTFGWSIVLCIACSQTSPSVIQCALSTLL